MTRRCRCSVFRGESERLLVQGEWCTSSGGCGRSWKSILMNRGRVLRWGCCGESRPWFRGCFWCGWGLCLRDLVLSFFLCGAHELIRRPRDQAGVVGVTLRSDLREREVDPRGGCCVSEIDSGRCERQGAGAGFQGRKLFAKSTRMKTNKQTETEASLLYSWVDTSSCPHLPLPTHHPPLYPTTGSRLLMHHTRSTR